VKFLVDENVNVTAVDALRSIFGEHAFATVRDEQWLGLLDVPLFEAMHSSGFHAIVTRNLEQPRDADERSALRRLGIHWVGLSSPKFGGLKGLALETAAIVAGLPYVLEGVDGSARPTAFHVRSVPSEATQRIKTETI
jgi:hypothetical protein